MAREKCWPLFRPLQLRPRLEGTFSMQLPLCPLAQWAWGLELLPVSVVRPPLRTRRGACTPIYDRWVAASWCPEGATCLACLLELCPCPPSAPSSCPLHPNPGFLP